MSFSFSKYLIKHSIFRPLTCTRIFSKSTDSGPTPNNPYFDKYAAKIAEVQKTSSGSRQTEDYNQPILNNLKPINDINSLKKSINKEHGDKKEQISIFQQQKDLRQIMKVETVQEKSPKEIESIWKEYHKIKDGVYGVLPAKSYENMHLNLKEYPIFLLPLPRAQGYEFIMCQFLDQSCYFTSLVNYQAFKENAPICLTVTYFTEFQKEKDIVLMRGEYDSSLKAYEAQCLTNQLQLYYGGQDEEKLQLLRKFNNQPEAFKHMDLISNFEMSLAS